MSAGGADGPGSRRLRAWAAQAIGRARTAWPGLTLSEEELADTAALRLSGGPPGGEAADPEALDPAELYVAGACARGDRPALAGFRARYFDPVAPALRRMGLDEAQREDIWQKLCERLFVGEGGAPPRVVHYAGSGELSGLVRVAATRVALNWLEQARRRAAGDDWLDGLVAEAADPELYAIKRQHRAELKEQIEAAIADLGRRERMVLRLHLVERLGIDAIAAACAVHRATAARMIARAKGELAERVRGRLVTRWNVSEASLPALKALIDSQIELSLERLLADG